MQTFLPYPDYRRSMQCLDPSRLGNQCYRECVTLIRGKWPNHPASRMWQGHHYHLALYAFNGLLVLKDERGRHYPRWLDYFAEQMEVLPDTGPPTWLGIERVHSSHRANLLRKDPQWYGRFGWTETPTEGYYWP